MYKVQSKQLGVITGYSKILVFRICCEVHFDVVMDLDQKKLQCSS